MFIRLLMPTSGEPVTRSRRCCFAMSRVRLSELVRDRAVRSRMPGRDGDGRLDLVINNLDAKPVLLRNVAAGTGHWLRVQLLGNLAKKSPRDAIGSVVYLTAGKVRQRRDVFSGAIYCSQNEMTLHFGLGSATKVDKSGIRWSDGSTELVTVPAVDTIMTITQGQPK